MASSGRGALVRARPQEAVTLRSDGLLHQRAGHMSQELGGRRLFRRWQGPGLQAANARMTIDNGAMSVGSGAMRVDNAAMSIGREFHAAT